MLVCLSICMRAHVPFRLHVTATIVRNAQPAYLHTYLHTYIHTYIHALMYTQPYAFRHHRGPVSAIVATRAAVITGSWDSTLCIAYLPLYRERWNDERAIKILKERCVYLFMYEYV